MDEIIHNPFVVGLVKSLGVILASEIGDKTFFIAAIMAMRNPRLTVSDALCPCLGPTRADAGVRRDTIVWVVSYVTTFPENALVHPTLQVFAGALGALAVMTVLSAALGWAAPNLVGSAG